ncbi:hypothetical protein [Vibrio barjaei]|uniref:hypothetical protein n=1 Tax=Vibrio barjaei TaxID=1676683 RepID=UPI002284E402|nr:hypothetical protein [Vibrio barjaei]MCY9873855.1 hypothetical protein [Vibrio barjaei]
MDLKEAYFGNLKLTVEKGDEEPLNLCSQHYKELKVNVESKAVETKECSCDVAGCQNKASQRLKIDEKYLRPESLAHVIWDHYEKDYRMSFSPCIMYGGKVINPLEANEKDWKHLVESTFKKKARTSRNHELNRVISPLIGKPIPDFVLNQWADDELSFKAGLNLCGVGISEQIEEALKTVSFPKLKNTDTSVYHMGVIAEKLPCGTPIWRTPCQALAVYIAGAMEELFEKM